MHRMILQANFGRCGKRAVAALLKALAALSLCIAASVAASAQINSPVGPIALSANLPSSLTVSATPALVNFTLATTGISNGSSPVTIRTSWAFATPSRMSIYAYFTNPASALADVTTHKIPSANVSASINGGAFTAFAGASPYAATSSITIFSRNEPGNGIARSRTDTLNLRITTTGLGLVPGNYTGLLVIQAQAL
jgi:hypothetical protein